MLPVLEATFVVAIAEGDPVTLVVPIDLEGVRDLDMVAVGQGDTEPRLTVQTAEGVATLAEPVGETGGDAVSREEAVVVIELYEAVSCGDPVAGEALGDTVKKLADTDTVCVPWLCDTKAV